MQGALVKGVFKGLSAVPRRAAKACWPRPRRRVVLRYAAGMMRSVSTLLSGSGKAQLFNLVRGMMLQAPPIGFDQLANVGRRPVTPTAAAIAGDIKWVRAPTWRPTKFPSGSIDAQRSPLALSGFITKTHRAAAVRPLEPRPR